VSRGFWIRLGSARDWLTQKCRNAEKSQVSDIYILFRVQGGVGFFGPGGGQGCIFMLKEGRDNAFRSSHSLP